MSIEIIEKTEVATKKVAKGRAVKIKKPSVNTDIARNIVNSRPKRIADLRKKKPLLITLGADPECHILDIEAAKIVSAIPILQKDKHNPIILGNDVKLYADNCLCEFSFNPSKSVEEMLERIKDALTRIQNHLGERYMLLPIAGHFYSDEELMPSYDINPMEIGCDPSYDCYKICINNPSPFPDNMRTGSFHIHVGNQNWENGDERLISFDSRHDAIKLMDLYVGLASVIFDKDETTVARRKIYGQAGSFRRPDYGIEYRPLSPGPLKSQEQTKLVLDLTVHAINHISQGTEHDILDKTDPILVQKAINTCDRNLAISIINTLDIPNNLMMAIMKDYPAIDIRSGWNI